MIEEQILWFEISVYDSVFVDVLHTCNDLLHEPDGFGFIEPLPFDDVVEEFTAFSILHDEVDVGFGFDDLVELDDVGMAEYFEDADFAGDTFDVWLFDNFLFLEGFDGHLFLGEDVSAQFDFAESTFADRAAYPVIAQYDFPVVVHGFEWVVYKWYLQYEVYWWFKK